MKLANQPCRITRAPVFVPGPRLLNVPSYDTRSQTYYAQPDCLAALEVPSRPSRDAIASARRFLLEELLGDFPFVADSDRALIAKCSEENKINGGEAGIRTLGRG